jgi:Flagellar P-ring protein
MRTGTPLALLAVVGLAAGCTQEQTSRSQVSDDFAEKVATATVGEKTDVSNAEGLPVSGVGLVWQLPGTGSKAKAPWREFLEKSLRAKQLNPREFLDDRDKTCSLVILNAVIPPGTRKGDPIDITVTLPPGSETTSLQGGVLFEADLYAYERAGTVRERMVSAGTADIEKSPVVSGDQLLLSQPLVRARGTLVVGRTDGGKTTVTATADAPTGYTAGMVWGGGRCLEDRPYWFVVASDRDKSGRLMGTIAARLNETFPPVGGGREKTANALNGETIFVRPPPQYRLNHGRFIIVARRVPMLPPGPADARRGQYERELLDPATALPAALSLEALGSESQAALRVGLESRSAWVRFAAAESLAYLGSTAGAAELAKLAEAHPGLRTHCLTALATLDDGVSTDRLAELMQHPDPQLRYGAFTALRSTNEQHPTLNGKHVRNAFWVHRVAPDSAGMVHLRTGGRAEVVVFGRADTLTGPFSLPIGTTFVVSAKPGADQVTVSKVVPGKDEVTDVAVKVPPTLVAVLNALGELGGGYAEAVEFVRRADAAKSLSVPVAVDAAPQGMPITQLVVMAPNDPTVERTNLEVTRASRGDVTPAGYDLPGPADTIQAKSADGPKDLARDPGRLFGPKKHPSEVPPEEEPKPAAPPPAGELSRNPGRLFGGK